MKNNTSNYPLDFKTTKNTVILMFIIFLPFNYIHEAGHLLVCNQMGYQGHIGITIMYGYTVCEGDTNKSMLFRFAGGELATIVGLVPLLVQKIRSKPFVCITLLSMSLTQLLNALIETFASNWYLANRIQPTLVMGIAGFTIFIVLLIIFARNKKVELEMEIIKSND